MSQSQSSVKPAKSVKSTSSRPHSFFQLPSFSRMTINPANEKQGKDSVKPAASSASGIVKSTKPSPSGVTQVHPSPSAVSGGTVCSYRAPSIGSRDSQSLASLIALFPNPAQDFSVDVPVPQSNEISADKGRRHGPSRLKFLAALDRLVVTKEVKTLKENIGMTRTIRFRIHTHLDQPLLLAFEEMNADEGRFSPLSRTFVIHFIGDFQQEVLKVVRVVMSCTPPFWCPGCCCGDVFIAVSCDRGLNMGTIRLRYSSWRVRFDILDEQEEVLYQVWAPFRGFTCFCCAKDVCFPITDANKSSVGEIRKRWTHAVRRVEGEAESYALFFPLDLEIKHKALMMAAIFLIDFAKDWGLTHQSGLD